MNKIVTIPGRVYDAMMQEVMRLPARKRKNYKTFVLSKRGCRTKVVYRDGRLWNRDDDPASPWHGQYVRMARTPDTLAGLADVSPFARAMLTYDRGPRRGLQFRGGEEPHRQSQAPGKDRARPYCCQGWRPGLKRRRQ